MTKPPAARLRRCAAGLLAALAATPALAVDTAWSGFASLGYARSDSDYTYQRFINRGGTFKRDSILAGQLDLRLSSGWSATLQGRLAAKEDSDDRVGLATTWAFVAWRPENDWLVRAGKMRLPLYLYSESVEVGVANDMVRLPHELYATVPTNDFKGLFVTHTLGAGAREFTVDAYAGRASTAGRTWLRDGLPPVLEPGARYRPVEIDVRGLALTSRDDSLMTRISLVASRTRLKDGTSLPVTYPYVSIGPGLGYWQVDDSLPGPGVPQTSGFHNMVLTLGAEWQFAPHWRLAAEGGRILQRDTELGLNSSAGYVAVFRRIGAWTPYLSLARQRSTDGLLQWRERLTTPSLPASLPGAQQINAAQRMAGESGAFGIDQRSTAFGLSYAISPTAKVKVEWMQTRVGRMSGQFDPPAGRPDAAGLRVYTLSGSLSVAF